MINWAYFPRSAKPTPLALEVVSAFQGAQSGFDSSQFKLPSNEVLEQVSTGLQQIGFSVETGKKKDQKVAVPVLYGNNGKVAKSFEADAHHALVALSLRSKPDGRSSIISF